MHQLTIEARDGLQLVGVAGELDTFGAAGFRDSLSQLGGAERVVIDLTDLTFVDSAGLHALFAATRISKDSGGEVVFVVPASSPVRRVIEIAQLADMAPVCESLEAAISSIAPKQPGGLKGAGTG